MPLPELVEVKTGEEDEEVKFQHRAKVYRFDIDSKEWKERGVGDLKILFHPDQHTYRVLLRRDQVHKIACNHYIKVEMKLEPMAKSETAVTWFAMDFCETEDGPAETKTEKLAARFKLGMISHKKSLITHLMFFHKKSNQHSILVYILNKIANFEPKLHKND